MAGDAGRLHDVEVFLEQPSGGLVAQVVKVQICDTGPAYGASVGAFYSLGGEAGEAPAVDAAGECTQHLDGGC